MQLKRKIVQIDENRCTGCGLCIINCAEHAIIIENGKAKVVSDNLCDGLGACLAACPEDALRIIEREADPFDEVEVHKRRDQLQWAKQASKGCAGQCPGSLPGLSVDMSSVLNWPVKLRLASPEAFKFFAGKDKTLVFTADCAPVVMNSFHSEYGRGNLVFTACPKFEDAGDLTRKLAAILQIAQINNCISLRMDVPCCGGLSKIKESAIKLVGRRLTLEDRIVSRQA